jgi:hypothetical protein
MTADHVLNALKDIEFDHFVPELEQQLANYRKIMKDRKERKSTANEAGNTEKATEEEEEEADDDIEIIDD